MMHPPVTLVRREPDERPGRWTLSRAGIINALDVGIRDCADTPWDPELACAFRTDGRIIHEELLADKLLAATVRVDS